MAEIFFISDTHFGHQNILTFTNDDGTMVRDFPSLDAMHFTMIDRWNATVNPQDKVYHLGDVGFNKGTTDSIMSMLNGKKRLIRGNHDLWPTSFYLKHFKEVYGVRQIDGYWLTHVPMHPQSMDRVKKNIHGHLHNRLVLIDHPEMFPDREIADDRYVNVSVERINYTPISFDEIKEK